MGDGRLNPDRPVSKGRLEWGSEGVAKFPCVMAADSALSGGWRSSAIREVGGYFRLDSRPASTAIFESSEKPPSSHNLLKPKRPSFSRHYVLMAGI